MVTKLYILRISFTITKQSLKLLQNKNKNLKTSYKLNEFLNMYCSLKYVFKKSIELTKN